MWLKQRDLFWRQETNEILREQRQFAHAIERFADLLQITITRLGEGEGVAEIIRSRLGARRLGVKAQGNRQAGRVVGRGNNPGAGGKAQEGSSEQRGRVSQQSAARLGRNI